MWIPPGRYTRGNPRGWAPKDELPVHEVEISRGFFLGKYEVTWAQYREFARETGRELPKIEKGFGEERFFDPPPREDDMPVQSVTWFEAQAYCEWAGLRLPTEAEWEWAAAGGLSPDHPWGAGDPTPENPVANLPNVHKGKQSTVSVYLFKGGASPFGCMHMLGNVWEWVEDPYSRRYVPPHPSEPFVDPRIPEDELERTRQRSRRGGGWNSRKKLARIGNRDGYDPNGRSFETGFRIAR